MSISKSQRSFVIAFPAVVAALLIILGVAARGYTDLKAPQDAPPVAQVVTADDYVVLSWNDLGMHCYNPDFQDLAVLPPFNTLWAQVVRVGDPPQIVTQGITVTYSFPDNTYSVGKSNFWDYGEQLFGEPLLPNIGLTGNGLSGEMELDNDHYVADGIPLTEYRDSDTLTPYPYQLAEVVVWDATTGAELARSTVVAPVSTEMHCDTCHYDGGIEDIATGRVETNILTLHDMENSDEYPPGHDAPLMERRPVLCAECHGSNALGAPGWPSLPSLSEAVHGKHNETVPSTLEGCYNCHPGPQTQCLRDVMSQADEALDCIDCHGNMGVVASNPDPWLNEPRCDNQACHGSTYTQDHALYRMSKEHGGLYCAACHDSPHAIAPSREGNDNIKFIQLQGHAGTLDSCGVCHLSIPDDEGPHGITARLTYAFKFEPDRMWAAEPSAAVVYTHTLQNTGTLSDQYTLDWHSSQDWAAAPQVSVGGNTVLLPVALDAGETAVVEILVSVPDSASAPGLTDKTVITATSLFFPSLSRTVVDMTMVPKTRVFLPLLTID
jgi:hypothetical protein